MAARKKPGRRRSRITPINIRSGRFPRVFSMMGQLVGFRFSGRASRSGQSLNILLIPVGKRPESWKKFGVRVPWTKRVAERMLFGTQVLSDEPFSKPLLARASLKNLQGMTHWQDMPEYLRSLAEEKKAAEVSYEINSQYLGPKGRAPLTRRGIGAALLSELEKKAREGGFDVLVARVEVGNTASDALLRKFGYKRSERPSEKAIYFYHKELRKI